MNFTNEQKSIIAKLKDCANELFDYMLVLYTLEKENLKDGYLYNLNLNKFKLALKQYDEIVKNEISDIDFIVSLIDEVRENLDEITGKYQTIALRLLGELEKKVSDNRARIYDRDINMVCLSLIDNFIETSEDISLNNWLIAVKYDIAFRFPEVTEESFNRKFDFKNDIYLFSDTLESVSVDNEDYEQYSLDEFAKGILNIYGNQLLNANNFAFENDEAKVDILYYFFMVESAILFISEEITWDFCETFFEIDDNNTMAINLLKQAIQSKSQTRKRFNFVSFIKQNR